MTGRTGSLSPEGPTISEADVARIAAEERLHHEWQRKAARVVAAASADVSDCRLLLDILGLDTAVLAAARDARSTGDAQSTGDGPAGKSARKRSATAA
jgi:hypothetical protein